MCGVAYFAHVGGFLSGAALAVVLLKMKLLGVERYEKSLLELWGLEKSETEEHIRKDIPFLQQQSLESAPASGEAEGEVVVSEGPEPFVEPDIFFSQRDKPSEEFIRFKCSCGKRLKVPAGFAGRSVRCRQCQRRLTIPKKCPSGPETIPAEPQKAKEQLIRFVCSCGKQIKVPAKFAGKSGRCPRCQSQLKIPDRPGK